MFSPYNDFAGCHRLLEQYLERRERHDLIADDRLTGLFLAVGLQQILEDHLHRESPALDRAVRRFGRYRHPAARVATRITSAGSTAVSRAHLFRAQERELAGWAGELTTLVELLGLDVMAPGSGALDDARRCWSRVRSPKGLFPQGLLDTVIRLPNSFVAVDQSPEDCHELAEKFSGRWARERLRPILVIGIRTSGSYLAPLLAGALRVRGYGDVGTLTIRPGRRWRASETSLVRGAAQRGAIALITDDPPKTGAAVDATARELAAHGIHSSSIVLALQLFGPTDTLPKALQPYDAVLLPWKEWAIHRRLTAEAVSVGLQKLLVGRNLQGSKGVHRASRVLAVDRVEGPPTKAAGGRRWHAGGVYRTRVALENGEELELGVRVRGDSLGYFGEFAPGVVAALGEYVPEMYGRHDGLLYREWLPSDRRVVDSSSAGLAERIASYVAARREGLRIESTLAASAAAQAPSEAVVGDLLGIALLGRLRTLVFPLTWLAAKRLVATAHPSLIDGGMEVSNWFLSPRGSAEDAVKVSADELRIRTAARLTFDSTFDLASAAFSFDVEHLLEGSAIPHAASFPERLLKAFMDRSGSEVDPERWFLYQLLYGHRQLEDLYRRVGQEGETEKRDRLVSRLLSTERALARTQQRYFAGAFFADVAPPTSGRFCALDVDWVLETRWLNFPAITPNGATALRALHRHGFRPVIATGRSLGEVQERCRAYRLAGGVAEYGAVVYDHVHGRETSVLSPAEHEALARLRHALLGIPGVHLDPAYRHIVRALRIVGGRRRRLDEDVVTAAVGAADVSDAVHIVRGGLQTDFVPVSADKARGLGRLLEAAGGSDDSSFPLAFASGDDLPDLAMLELAEKAYAPANATARLREHIAGRPGFELMAKPRGAGLLEAVVSFLGHRPSRCSDCLLPSGSARAKLVTAPLAALDGTRGDRIRSVLALAVALLASEQPGDTVSTP